VLIEHRIDDAGIRAPAKRGTYAGLIEKIPYLRDLSVSAVELLPAFAFDEQDGPPGLGNYWGYQPSRFSRRMTGTAPDRTRLAQLTSFVIWSRRCTAPG
jgi:isoamylase